MSKYDEIMDKVEVTDEMRIRILENVKVKNFHKTTKVIRFRNYKKFIYIAACFAILFVGFWALPTFRDNNPPNQNPAELSGSGIANFTSAEELSQKVGFKMADISTLEQKANEARYTSYDKEMAEITYCFENQVITFRKSIGTEDNSGDYNEYNTEKKITGNGYDIVLKGNNDNYSLAVWTDGKFAYSVSLDNAVSQEKIEDIVLEVK